VDDAVRLHDVADRHHGECLDLLSSHRGPLIVPTFTLPTGAHISKGMMLPEATALMKSAHAQLAPIVAAQPTSIPFRDALAETCREWSRALTSNSPEEAQQKLEQACDHLRQIASQKPASVLAAQRLKAAEVELQKLLGSQK